VLTLRIRVDATPSTLSFNGLWNVKVFGIEVELTAPNGSTRTIVCDLSPSFKATSDITYGVIIDALRELGCPTWQDECVEGCVLLVLFCTDAGPENQGCYKHVLKFKSTGVILLWAWCKHHQLNLIERRLLAATAGRGRASRVPGALESTYGKYTLPDTFTSKP